MVNPNDSPEPQRPTGEPVPPMARPYKIDLGSPGSPPPLPPPGPQPESEPVTGFMDTPVTLMVMGACAVIFAIMCAVSGGQAFMNPSNALLKQFGGDNRILTLTDGQYWRLVTNTFLHGGVIHLAMNMYVLSDVGRAVERLYGSSKFLVIYLMAGIGGSIVSLFFLNPAIFSVGASGAVFGSFGAFLAMTKGHEKSFEPNWVKSVTRSVITLLIINLIWGLSNRNIDNAAHIGGFLTGVLAGFCVLPARAGDRNWTKQNVVWAVFLLLMLAAGGYADVLTVGDDPR